MYQAVQRYRNSKGNRSLWLWLAACLLVCAVVIGVMIWGYWFQMRFRAFVSDLSDSTTYAYRNDCLRAEIDGVSVRVTGENMYQIYNAIVSAGPGRLGSAPDEAPAALLDYGDGSRMEVWSVRLVNSSTDLEYGLFLRYTGPEGSVYAYDTDQLALSAVTHCLSPYCNQLWEG